MVEWSRALVTGASGAIGRDVALSLASHGFEVWLGCKGRFKEADELREEILSRGGAAQVLPFDVADYESCQSKVGALVAERGPVSALAHCAGVVRDGLLLRTSPADWNAVLATNLSGFYHVCRAVLRGMIQQRSGSIVAIGSVMAGGGVGGWSEHASRPR